MSAVPENSNPSLAQSSAHEAMLNAVRELAAGPLAQLADDIDRLGT